MWNVLEAVRDTPKSAQAVLHLRTHAGGGGPARRGGTAAFPNAAKFSIVIIDQAEEPNLAVTIPY